MKKHFLSLLLHLSRIFTAIYLFLELRKGLRFYKITKGSMIFIYSVTMRNINPLILSCMDISNYLGYGDGNLVKFPQVNYKCINIFIGHYNVYSAPKRSLCVRKWTYSPFSWSTSWYGRGHSFCCWWPSYNIVQGSEKLGC